MAHSRTLPQATLLFALAVASAASPGCRKDRAPAPAAAPSAPASPATAPAQPAADGRVQMTVTEEGFVPSRIVATAGKPITLVITRKTDRTCAREILFAGQEGKTELPLNKPVEVSYTPKTSGEVKFGCAMGMMIGGVIVAS